MRIWIINHYARPRNSSGLTRHGVLAHYLQQAGHSVTIFLGAFSREHLPVIEVPRHRLFVDQLQEEVRFRYVRTRPFRGAAGRLLNMLSFRKNVLRSVDGLGSPDVIVGSCPHPYAVDAARALAQRFGVPFVYEIRDIWPQSLVELGMLSRWHPICWELRRLERRFFRRADAVVSVLPGIRQYAREHGVAPDRICYIPNGVDPSLLWRVGSPGPPFVLSYFGVFGSANDVSTIVEAAARLQQDPRGKDVLVRLVGSGPKAAQLRRRAVELDLQNVEFLDNRAKSELAPLAQQTHAFVHSHYPMSVVERYGMSVNKVFDYLAAARPLVFACNSCYNPVDEAGAGITVPPGNPTAMAEAILRLRNTPAEQRERMGHNGRAYVMKHHNCAELAQRLEQFLVTRVGRAGDEPQDDFPDSTVPRAA